MTIEKTVEKEFLFYEEGAIKSVLTDIFTFGIIFGGLLLNRYYLGNKWYLDVFFIFCILVSLTAKTSNNWKKFTSKKELKKYVNGL